MRANESSTAQDFHELHLTPLLDQMRAEKAHWLAEIEIKGCDSEKANRLANLAANLATTALQLATPYLDTRMMATLETARGSVQRVTVQKVYNHYTGGFANQEPGLSIGDGYLFKIVMDCRTLIDAIGLCVQSYVSESYRLERLEQSWCDAAYWFHQGLAEQIDSIAVAKLETAIEVLLGAESSSGSEKRMLQAFEAVFGLKPDDPITGTSLVTAKQFAKSFVRDRSRVLHGTWSTLQKRLDGSRDALEHVAASVLRLLAIQLEAFTKSPKAKDDIDAFLGWINAQRTAATP